MNKELINAFYEQAARAGLTRAQAAALLGLTPRSLQFWQKNQRGISAPARRLIEIYNAMPDKHRKRYFSPD